MRNLFLAIVLTSCANQLLAQTTNHPVYALYVVNIAKYSEWPSGTSELKISVLGKTKVYEELMKHNGKTVNGHVLKISQIEEITEIGDANILYVADGRSGTLGDVVLQTESKPLLIIGEREGLFKKGAGFSFVVMENNTLRFDINATQLEKRNIKVSKNLSSLANSSI